MSRNRSIRSSWRSRSSSSRTARWHPDCGRSSGMERKAAPGQHRCSVLVVEDDPELRELLRVALTGDGYAVSTAANGRDALRHLRSTASTCIIVLDLALPVMDGRQFRAVQLRDRSLAWKIGRAHV